MSNCTPHAISWRSVKLYRLNHLKGLHDRDDEESAYHKLPGRQVLPGNRRQVDQFGESSWDRTSPSAPVPRAGILISIFTPFGSTRNNWRRPIPGTTFSDDGIPC